MGDLPHVAPAGSAVIVGRASGTLGAALEEVIGAADVGDGVDVAPAAVAVVVDIARLADVGTVLVGGAADMRDGVDVAPARGAVIVDITELADAGTLEDVIVAAASVGDGPHVAPAASAVIVRIAGSTDISAVDIEAELGEIFLLGVGEGGGGKECDELEHIQ